jgi:IS5 family transposase
VETDIHHPTDSSLLWDAVRVLTRLGRRLGALVPAAREGFANRTRRARRRMQEISRLTPAQRPRQQPRKYRDLLRVTTEVVAMARAAVVAATRQVPAEPLAAGLVTDLCQELEHFAGLADQVIAQTRRRVLEGEQVPVQDKVLSIFEPHTDLIVRGKARTPAEFGHKIFLTESRDGLITDYRVLAGNPVDEEQVLPSLRHHTETFGHAPELYAADRGFYSPANLTTLIDAGVTLPCIPQRGGRKTDEQTATETSRRFKKGQRFRAGVEGRISVLLRGRGMRRCPLEGRPRFEVFVGAAVLANNLLRIADLLRRRAGPRRRAA